MINKQPVLYIVMPCYNEEEVLPETSKRMFELVRDMIATGEISADSRIMMVDDGSKDNTWDLIQRLHEKDNLFSGVKLTGNRGHQYALMAGLMTAREHCDISISIDADLQDDINVMRDMVAEYKNGNQIVYGVRSARESDTLFKRITARGYYKLLIKMGVNIIYDHADYRLMSRDTLDALSAHKEVNLFLRGMAPMIGFKSAKVYYERSERFAGESKYPLSKMLALAWQGITSFSTRPIRMVTNFGILFTVLSIVYAFVTLILGKFNIMAAMLASIWFIGGLIMISVGVVGEYVGKTYMETKRRPRYIIDEVLNE